MISKFILNKVTNPRVYDYDETVKIEKTQNHYKDFDELKKTEYIVKSFDGYELHCCYIPHDGSRKYVIISHDHAYTRMGSLKFMHIFRKLGFNCVIYDERGCGKNSRAPITMGFNEARDLRYIIADLRAKFGEDIYLGLHGESMGAAFSLMTLKDEKDIDFVISDCAYADLYKLLIYDAKRFTHMPEFFIKRGSKLCKKQCGFYFEDIKPYECIEDTETPICFIHGEEDDFVLPSHCMTLYQAAGDYHEINSFPRAAHLGCYSSDPQRYERIIRNFLKKAEELRDRKKVEQAI